MTLYAKIIARGMRGDRRPSYSKLVACQTHAFSRFRIVRDQGRSAFIDTRQSLAALLGINLLSARTTAQKNQRAKENPQHTANRYNRLYHNPSHLLDPNRALLVVWLFGDGIVGIERHQVD